EQLKRDFLQRLLTRISQITQRLPLDVDYLQFAVDQEMALFRSLSGQQLQGLIEDLSLPVSAIAKLLGVSEKTRDLNVFRMGWDNHPLRTERNLSPHQLWTMGLLHNPIDVPDLAEEMEDADLDFNPASEPDETSSGVILPPVESPLSEQDMAGLLANIDVTRPSGS
ncbi:Glutamine--fructose-6-phosphate aminotransferase [isomerizing], partial [Dissostichus eleginoides]